MIRVIDLRGQVVPDDSYPEFALYCTVTNHFREISGEQTWNSKADLLQACRDDCHRHDTARYLGLLPDWVPDEVEY